MRYSRGFSLIELMVALAITAILVAVGIPSFKDFMVGTSVNSDRDRLFSALLVARSEAIKRGRFVNVCKTTNQTTCSTVASTGWQAGWLVYVDENNDSALSGTETVLRAGAAMSSGITVTSQASLPSQMRFNGLGRLQTGSGDLTFAHSSGAMKYQRKLAIDLTGRVSLKSS